MKKNKIFQLAGIICFLLLPMLLLAQYRIENLQIIELNKQAGYADQLHNVATLAAKPNGGAYIQWASNNGFNNRSLCSATSTVYVTEVNNAGQVQGSDINLGTSLPYGIAATSTGFGSLIGDGDKLIFKTHNSGSQTGSTTIMNHRAKSNCGHYFPLPTWNLPDPGLDFGTSGPGWAFSTPYLPEKGDIAFGGNEFATAFGHSNDFKRSRSDGTSDSHSGDAYITFNNTAGNARLSVARADHSVDRRIEHVSGNTFVSVRLNDGSGLKLYKHENGVRVAEVKLFETKTDYTNDDETTTADIPYRHRYCTQAEQNTNDPKCNWKDLYGIGGNGAGTSYGVIGDLHSVGDGMLALTYGIRPASYRWNEFNQGSQTKNQLDFALLDTNGNIDIRRILYQPTGGERLAWVKSVMVDGGFLIFFKTETSNGTGRSVRMMVIDEEGITEQAPVVMPAVADFNRADEVEILSNGTIAWTSTVGGQLKLHLIPNSPNILLPSAPVAKAATNSSTTSFTANWTNVGIITDYRIDVSTDNFQTFVVQNQSVNAPSFTLQQNVLADTRYSYRVRAINSAGASPYSNTMTTTTSALKYNLGGSALTTSTLGSFIPIPASQISGASNWSRSGNIGGTNGPNDIPLYNTQQYGNMNIAIPRTNGSYKVILHFAELYVGQAGSRVFHVDIEGARKLSNFDVFANVGYTKALVKVFDVVVNDGVLNINLSGQNQGIINALEIIPQNSTGAGS